MIGHGRWLGSCCGPVDLCAVSLCVSMGFAWINRPGYAAGQWQREAAGSVIVFGSGQGNSTRLIEGDVCEGRKNVVFYSLYLVMVLLLLVKW